MRVVDGDVRLAGTAACQFHAELDERVERVDDGKQEATCRYGNR